ncbi:serine/threonine-protein kinase [Actinomadura harenae]|uniref:serine/threonine-protein kinase n=1 Tax=Actinomadura harenae TaxID=2483351 RepID=UPI0018F65F31|nr:serine/threonine-protein kinase [Actinomadura harenae]
MPSPLRPGDPERLGPYRLTARLGQGGMGTVLLGEDPSDGRRVAVKVVNPELAGDEAFRERFRREVTAARRVSRFCTAAVLDAELDRDPLYVVTEFVDGPTLFRAVRDGGPLRGGDLEGLAVGVATALSAIHAAGIVHRDLKPSNVLLSPTGPRVIDFGIARPVESPDGPTTTGRFVGTPAYIAPELMRDGPLTPAADVFAWGCVVTFAATGSPPFAGRNVHETLYRVAHEPPVLDGLDGPLLPLVEAALDKDPARRPSVPDLLAALINAPAPTLVAEPEGGRGRRPPKRITAVALVGALVLSLGGAAGWRLLGDAPDPRVPRLGAALVPDGSLADRRSGWDEDECGTYGGHGFAIQSDRDDPGYCVAPNETASSHFVAGARVRLGHASGRGPWQAGVLLLGTDDRDYAVLLRSDGSARLVKETAEGETHVLDTVPAGSYEPVSGSVRVQVEVRVTAGRTSLRAWLDGDYALDADDEDQPFTTGRTGLVADPLNTVSAKDDFVEAWFSAFTLNRAR